MTFKVEVGDWVMAEWTTPNVAFVVRDTKVLRELKSSFDRIVEVRKQDGRRWARDIQDGVVLR